MEILKQIKKILLKERPFKQLLKKLLIKSILVRLEKMLSLKEHQRNKKKT